EVWCIDLIGRARFRPMAGLIVDKLMSDDEADYLVESCVDALVRMGTAEGVRLIQQRYPKMTWGTHLHAVDVLRRIKLPASEAAVIALLQSETDRTVRTNLAEALCELAA